MASSSATASRTCGSPKSSRRRTAPDRILTRYVTYYHQARTHLALDKDAPDLRPIELPAAGTIVEVPEVGGLQHRYLRRAALSQLVP
jgi:hypothetical protein